MSEPTKDPAAAWRGLRWVKPAVGNWTLYFDVPVPFTRRVLIIDIGLHPSLGWRWAR